MYQCTVTYKAGNSGKHIYNHQTKEHPEAISEQTWGNHIILKKNYKKPISIIKVHWEKCSPVNAVRKHLPDINMEANKVTHVNEKIAQLTNLGLTAMKIAKEIRYITKPELIQVIMGYQTLE